MLVQANGNPIAMRTDYVMLDRFDREPGPLGGLWRGFNEDHPDAFDVVGVVPGGVATIGLTRPENGGGPYVPNPEDYLGAYDYGDYPGYSMPGIGGEYIETGSESVVVSLTYGGHYAYETGLHTEVSAALHVTPDAPLYALGGWFAEFAPGVGICIIAGVCNPPEDITALDYSLFNLVEGQRPIFSYDTDGVGMIVRVDGVQVPLNAHGMSRFPIPEELRGSTKHGFEIDQHIVNYTGGAPDLTRLAEAVAFSDIAIATR